MFKGLQSFSRRLMGAPEPSGDSARRRLQLVLVQDRIGLDEGAGTALLDTLAHFLERQRWLVRRVDIG